MTLGVTGAKANSLTLEYMGTVDTKTNTLNLGSTQNLTTQAAKNENIAMRYALVNLLPFAVQGGNYSTAYSRNGELDMYDEKKGTGQLHLDYIRHRLEVMAHIFGNYSGAPAFMYYEDAASGRKKTLSESGIRLYFGDAKANAKKFPEVLPKASRYGAVHAYGMEGNDQFTGDKGDDWLYGGNDNDKLWGKEGNDRLFGDAGADTLYSGAGNDVLTGGAGGDAFVFDTKLNAKTNVDTITDFKHGTDKIHLSKSIFSKLKATGTLSAGNFYSSKDGTASDSNDYILYNTTTGVLLYDKDGSGKGAAIQFATLSKKPKNVTASDFFVIS